MKAIVYTSNTGHTKKYAEIIGEMTGLPIYSLEEAQRKLKKKTEIIYMGWLFVGSVKGYRKAAKRFNVRAVCGVGLCDTGAMLDDVRKSISLPEEVPLFTLQGGIDKTKLTGINAYMIKMLIKMMTKKKDKTEDEVRMLELLNIDKSYVCREHTAEFMKWCEENNN